MICCDGCGAKCEAIDECRVGAFRLHHHSSEGHVRHVCDPCRKRINAAAANVFMIGQMVSRPTVDGGIEKVPISLDHQVVAHYRPAYVTMEANDGWKVNHAFTLEPEPPAADPVGIRLRMAMAVVSLLAATMIGFAIGRMIH